jgi:hypothetical protein
VDINMAISLPRAIKEKVASFPESSYGANRVTLVISNGRRINDVIVAWGSEIVKINNKAVSRPEDIDFQTMDIIDVLPES